MKKMLMGALALMGMTTAHAKQDVATAAQDVENLHAAYPSFRGHGPIYFPTKSRKVKNKRQRIRNAR